MNKDSLVQLPLPTLLLLIGAALAAIAAAGGAHYGQATLSALDPIGRAFLGAVALAFCGVGIYLADKVIRSGRSLTVGFKELLGDAVDDERYDLKNLTTVDAFLDDIYRSHLNGVVPGQSYGTEWILAKKGGEKLYNIGSRWAAVQGMHRKPGQRIPIDERLVRNLPSLFRPGTELRVQRLEQCPPFPEAPEVRITYPHGATVQAQVEDGKRYLPIEGTLKEIPDDSEIWVLVKDVNQPRWWPHGPAVINGGNWTISRLYPGPGKQIKLQACVVGKSGQALIHYYKRVSSKMNQLSGSVMGQFPGANLEDFRAPEIADIGTDMTIHDDRTVSVL